MGAISKFLTSNIAYIIWFVIYFSIAWVISWAVSGNMLYSFIFVAVIYGISITIALSPIGEIILRLLQNCREPSTESERSYLLPLFEEVYENAIEIDPNLNRGIKLYIMDDMYINAFAMGRKTIAVTMGAMTTWTKEELKGVLAHEFGHMSYGHTKALLLSTIGNIFFYLIVWAFKVILGIVEFLANVFAHFNVLGIAFSIILFVTRLYVNILIFLFVNLGEIILALNSRSNEIEADTFAYEVGYGRELISGLYLLQKTTMNTKVGIMEQLKASHPHMADRIAHLERLENENIEE